MNNLIELINILHVQKILNNYNFSDLDLSIIKKSKIDKYLKKCLDILNINKKIYENLYQESKNFLETKYHSENLITHLYTVGYLCAIFSSKFNIDEEYAFKLGFFHDIGKPFAKKMISTKKRNINIYTGHSQVGDNICNHLNLDKEICWCTSFHMCCCSHNRSFEKTFDMISSYQCITFEKEINIDKYLNSYACLIISDTLGRLSNNCEHLLTSYNYSQKWLKKFREKIKNNYIEESVKELSLIYPNNSIIILTLGHSGFGKTTFSEKIKNFCYENKISVKHAERDHCYYMVYSKIKNISFEDAKKINYNIVYSYLIDNDLKKDVQKNWVEKLNEILDSNCRIKIIDSIQLMYTNAWKGTIESLSEDAKSNYFKNIKFGYYGFPLSIYEIDYIPKTNIFEIIPRPVNDSFSYPTLNLEINDYDSFSFENIDIGYGNYDFIKNSISNYLKYNKGYINKNQVHIIKLLQNNKSIANKDDICNTIINAFPKGIINTSIDIEHDNISIIRFSYRDGMQIFNGPSRDYRGENLIYDYKKNEYYVARASLPVFVDYENIENDTLVCNMITQKNKYKILPKFDGSLFVLTFIKKDTKQYQLLKKIIGIISNDCYIDNYRGLWCFGSKSLMFTKDQNGKSGVLSRINKSIEGSYKDKHIFIEKCYNEIVNNKLLDYDNISLCFESIEENPTSELTVKYDKSFCPFLGFILMKNNNKEILLPENLKYISPYATIHTFETWEEVIKFKDDGHKRLLDGSLDDEPEGYVVWIDNTNIGIKLKHLEYYAAHKPYKPRNYEMANEIENSEKYKKLKGRLIKFRYKPPLIDILNENFFQLLEILKDKRKNLYTKKEWAKYWYEKKNLEETLKIFININNIINEYYPPLSNKLLNKQFGILMDYFINNNNYIEFIINKYLT
jgi:hypothetical protein